MAGVTQAVMEQQKRAALAALQNEALTRKRVEMLEQWAQEFTRMGFWRRVRWILVGR